MLLDRICIFKHNLIQTPQILWKIMLKISCCPVVVAKPINLYTLGKEVMFTAVM